MEHRIVVEVSPITNVDGSTTLFLFSHEPWTTRPTDTPPNKPVHGILKSAGSLRRELFSGAHVTGAIKSAFGLLSMRNQTPEEEDAGDLDAWMAYGISGADVAVRWGPKTGAYPDDYYTLYVAKGQSLPADESDVTVRLRDELDKLDRPVVTDPFLLTGGLEGTGTISKRKQFVSSDPGLHTVILVDRIRQIYFVQSTSDGGLRDLYLISGVEISPFDVFDNGVEITREAHYSSAAEMLATSPSAGSVRYWFGVAQTSAPSWRDGPVYFRLGSPPAGEIRVFGVGYPNQADHDRHGGIAVGSFFASHFALRAGIPLTNIDTSSNNVAVGQHMVDDSTTFAGILDDACLALQGWYGINRLGKFRSGYLLDPEDEGYYYGVDPSLFGTPDPARPTTSLYTFNRLNSKNLKRTPVAGMEAPVWSVLLESGKTWPISTFGGAASVLMRDYLSRELWASTAGVSDSTRTADPGATHLTVNVSGRYFQNAFSLRLWLERMFVLYGGRRHFWSWDVPLDDDFDPDIFDLDLHDVVTLQYPTLGLSSGKKVRIVAMTIDLASNKPKITFTGWGGTKGSYTGTGVPPTGEEPPIGPGGVPLGQTYLGTILLEAYATVPGTDALLDKIFSNLTLLAVAALGSDPYFSDVILLLHGEGSDASTTITDSSSSARTCTASGNAQIDIAQNKAGSASILFDGTGDYVTVSGTSSTPTDYTVEMFFRVNSSAADQAIFNCPTSNWVIYRIHSTSKIELWEAGASRITGSATASTGTWYHLAWTRTSGVMHLWLDGVEIGSGYSHATTFEIGSPRLGTPNAVSFWFDGWLDEVRITQNVARYTATFTPPTVPFPDF